MAFLAAKGLSKTIKKTTILDNVSMELQKGRIYGLQGKNGSGKTMLLRAFAGLIRPSAGEVIIDGQVLGKAFSFPPSIGILIENPSFISRYTGFKNLSILAHIQNKISDLEIKESLDLVGLDPCDARPYRNTL